MPLTELDTMRILCRIIFLHLLFSSLLLLLSYHPSIHPSNPIQSKPIHPIHPIQIHSLCMRVLRVTQPTSTIYLHTRSLQSSISCTSTLLTHTHARTQDRTRTHTHTEHKHTHTHTHTLAEKERTKDKNKASTTRKLIESSARTTSTRADLITQEKKKKKKLQQNVGFAENGSQPRGIMCDQVTMSMTSFPKEGQKLKLKARSKQRRRMRPPRREASSSIFGQAKPREQVLKAKGVDASEGLTHA